MLLTTKSGRAIDIGSVAVPLITCAFIVGFLVSIDGMASLAVAFPRVIIAVLVAMLAAQAVRTVIRRWRSARQEVAGSVTTLDGGSPSSVLSWLSSWRTSTLVVLLTVLFIVGVPRLGFVTTIVVFLACSMVVLRVRDLQLAVVYVIASAAATYVTFAVLLNIPLPSVGLDALLGL